MAKTIIKYLITLSIGVSLLWYLVNSQSETGKENIIKGFLNADYSWLTITIVIAFIEKIIRAYRWNLLMEPLSHKPPLRNTFNAVMVAYFANIFAPRMGEVARCAILKKTDDVPVEASLGTVLAERTVDVICLLLIIPVALLLEYQKITELLLRIVDLINGLFAKAYWILILLLALFLILIVVAYIYRETIKNNKFFIKVRKFAIGLWESIVNIRKMEKKGQFIFCTILIWLCYFFMTYLAFFSLDATSGLNMSAGLIILVVGGLGMAAPMQAGMGSFHAIVKETLEGIYKISSEWSLPYAFLVWASQLVLAFVVGLICLIIALNFSKKEKVTLNDAKL